MCFGHCCHAQPMHSGAMLLLVAKSRLEQWCSPFFHWPSLCVTAGLSRVITRLFTSSPRSSSSASCRHHALSAGSMACHSPPLSSSALHNAIIVQADPPITPIYSYNPFLCPASQVLFCPPVCPQICLDIELRYKQLGVMGQTVPVLPARPVQIQLIPYIDMKAVGVDVHSDVLGFQPEWHTHLQRDICAGLCNNTEDGLSAKKTHEASQISTYCSAMPTNDRLYAILQLVTSSYIAAAAKPTDAEGSKVHCESQKMGAFMAYRQACRAAACSGRRQDRRETDGATALPASAWSSPVPETCCPLFCTASEHHSMLDE